MTQKRDWPAIKQGGLFICPTCGALPLKWCTTAKGAPAGNMHTSRLAIDPPKRLTDEARANLARLREVKTWQQRQEEE